MTDVHSCSYYCDRPECIKAQRDELRERLAQAEQEPVNGITKDKALKQVLETLEEMNHEDSIFRGEFDDDIAAIKEALTQPEQEPVAHTLNCVCGAVWDVSPDGVEEMVHAPNPPQRKPMPPQSPCEMTQAEGRMFKLGWLECEAAHGIKGEA